MPCGLGSLFKSKRGGSKLIYRYNNHQKRVIQGKCRYCSQRSTATMEKGVKCGKHSCFQRRVHQLRQRGVKYEKRSYFHEKGVLGTLFVDALAQNKKTCGFGFFFRFFFDHSHELNRGRTRPFAQKCLTVRGCDFQPIVCKTSRAKPSDL